MIVMMNGDHKSNNYCDVDCDYNDNDVYYVICH